MKLTTVLAVAITMTAAAWGQNPDAIDNARSVAKSLQQIKTNETNAALGLSDAPASPDAKPAPGSPTPAVKPATIPGAKPASVPASSRNNTLERVNIVHSADDIQIEISSREAVTPKVSKLSSPARVVVELPATAMATTQSKIPVGSAGVKDVRIGMNSKSPPTTSVVVDLEQACAYELTPGPGNTMILTLHTSVVAKSTPAAASKTSPPAPKLQSVVAKSVVGAPAAKSKAAPGDATVKAHDAFIAKKPAAKSAATTKIAADHKPDAATTAEAPKPPKPEEKKWAMNGKRDPFFSPVVQQPSGSGCSTGKKCLEIGQINLRGVVKAESGFIAVVTNTLNKAYFLHENDPVFNGYVVRITGDSVVFQETVQDKLGKATTHEVVKRISTPAV